MSLLIKLTCKISGPFHKYIQISFFFLFSQNKISGKILVKLNLLSEHFNIEKQILYL